MRVHLINNLIQYRWSILHIICVEYIVVTWLFSVFSIGVTRQDLHILIKGSNFACVEIKKVNIFNMKALFGQKMEILHILFGYNKT